MLTVRLDAGLSSCGGILGADFACPAFGDLQHGSLDACQIKSTTEANAICKSLSPGCATVVGRPPLPSSPSTR